MLILKPIEQYIKLLNSFNKSEKPYTLGIFRIIFVLQLLLVWYQTHSYKLILFDAVDGLQNSHFPIQLLLISWLISLVLLLVGYQTKYAAVANYLCVILVTDVFARSDVSSYFDDVIITTSIFLIVLPVNASFSIDSILLPELRYKVNRLHYLSIWVLLFGAMYFLSGVSKLYSKAWLNGLGIWMPLNMPFLKWTDALDGLQDYYLLMVGLNYFIIAWELLFVFFIFNDKWRKYFVVTGVLFHFFIALLFYFPKSALSMCLLYVIFIPNSFWEYLGQKISTRNRIKVFLPTNSRMAYRYYPLLKAIDLRNKYKLCSNEKEADIVIKSPYDFAQLLTKYWLLKPLQWINWDKQPLASDNFAYTQFSRNTGMNQRGIIGFILVLTLLNVFALMAYSYHKGKYWFKQNDVTTNNKPINRIPKKGFKTNTFGILKSFMGISSKAVFTDKSLLTDRTYFAITYEENNQMVWLPINNEKGLITTDFNQSGYWWKIHHFKTIDTSNIHGINPEQLIRSIMFLAQKKRIKLNHTFNVLAKKYTMPKQYEKGYYLKMYQIPWKKIGIIQSVNDTLRFIPITEPTVQ